MNKLRKWAGEKLLRIKASPLPDGAMLPVRGGGQYIFINGQITWISDKLASYVKDGYQENDIIYSAVRMIMEKVSCAPWGLYKVEDESSLKKYNAIISGKQTAKDFAEIKALRKKALVPLDNVNKQAGKLSDLLKWPNEETTWNDLVAENIAYALITGNTMLWANLLDAGANSGLPQELYNMPAQYMVIKAKLGWPQRKVGFQLNHGEIRDFTAEEVMHRKFWNPEYNINGSGLYGQSPLKAARRRTTRSNAAKKAGAVQLDNNGSAGVLYVDDALVPPTGREAQMKLMKDAWSKEYSGAENYGKIAFSGYKMGYANVGTSLKEMGLVDVEELDLRGLANIWGIPSQLLNDPENKSYNNQKEAEKALTSRCALPQLIAFRDHFNRKIQTHWGFQGQNVYADFDMSVYSELQEDQGEKWLWVSKLPVSSAYKLELMGLDVPDDPNLDIILVDGTQIPLSDLINGISDQQMQQINDSLNKAGLTDYLRVAR